MVSKVLFSAMKDPNRLARFGEYDGQLARRAIEPTFARFAAGGGERGEMMSDGVLGFALADHLFHHAGKLHGVTSNG